MRFEIIGSGAMGLLFGAKLLLQGENVHFWTRTLEQASQLMNQGLTYEQLNGTKQQLLHGTYSMFDEAGISRNVDEVDCSELVYIVLAVKQNHINDKLLQRLQLLVNSYSNVVLILLQNGYGHLDIIEPVVTCPIITIVTKEAAKKIGGAHILHTGSGVTSIGDQLGRDIDSIHQKNIRNHFDKAGFQMFMSKNIKEEIYSKLIINAVINPLTAMYSITNGELLAHPVASKLMKELFEETRSILSHEMLELSSFSFERVLEVCKATSENHSSMMTDIKAGAITEIESINGAVVQLANKYGTQSPLNQSMLQLILVLHPDQ